jgi:RecB family endonuclease NucS
MRLIVARCSARYSGRLDTSLPEAVRLIMIKADGTVMLWSDGGGSSVKPLNWMTPPTVIEEIDGDVDENLDGGASALDAADNHDAANARDTPARIIVRKYAGKTEDRLEITLHEVLSDVTHDMGSPDEDAGLAKDGVEAHLQELLAEQPHWCGEGLRLVRREWPTDIGPVDLMCRDADDEWVAVEIKRVAGIDAVEQLSRYLERLRADPGFESCRGVLAAQSVKPQARVLANSRGLRWVEVDLAVLRGEREPELRLFVA